MKIFSKSLKRIVPVKNVNNIENKVKSIFLNHKKKKKAKDKQDINISPSN